jgi:hypothetical protein
VLDSLLDAIIIITALTGGPIDLSAIAPGYAVSAPISCFSVRLFFAQSFVHTSSRGYRAGRQITAGQYED